MSSNPCNLSVVDRMRLAVMRSKIKRAAIAAAAGMGSQNLTRCMRPGHNTKPETAERILSALKQLESN